MFIERSFTATEFAFLRKNILMMVSLVDWFSWYCYLLNDTVTFLSHFKISWIVAVIMTEFLSSFRHIYLGLTVMLGTVSIFLSIAVLFTLKKNCVSKHRSFRTKTEGTMVSTRIRKENCTTSDLLLQPNYWPGKETQL